jgi:glycerol uptake facilitator-like aquaporin
MQLSLGLPQGSRPLAEHSIYWVGPILGALAGCIFYSSVLRPPVRK